MNNYLGYIRVSTPKQGTQGTSLQEQKAAIEGYARRNGLSISAWFEERETAAKQGRQAFSRMLQELDRRRARGVIIHKIDRSARNLKDWARLGDLIDRGADIRFAHDSIDLTSRGGRLSADIQAVVAADFIRNLREEVRKGRRGRLNQGLYPNRAPIGYLDMGRGRAKEIDPVKGPLVRQAFELYATGTFSFETLKAELHLRGLRGHGGNPVSLNGLTTILNNPFYVGIICIRRTGETYQGVHQPLIAKALFDRVHAVLRGKRIGVPFRHDFLFRRLVRCSTCHRSLIGERQKSRHVYYRCHSPQCGTVSLNEVRIDAEVRQRLALLRFDEAELGDIRDLIEEIRFEQKDEIANREAALRLRLAKCDGRLARLTDAVIDGVLDSDAFNERKTAILGEKRGLLDELEGNATAPTLADRLTGYVERADMAQLGYDKGLPEEKREILRSLVSNFSGHGNTPAIALYSPFQELLDLRLIPAGEPRRDEPRTRARKILDIFLLVAREKFDQTLEVSGEHPLPKRIAA